MGKRLTGERLRRLMDLSTIGDLHLGADAGAEIHFLREYATILVGACRACDSAIAEIFTEEPSSTDWLNLGVAQQMARKAAMKEPPREDVG